MKVSEALFGLVGVLVVLAAIIVAGVLLDGMVASLLWNWFMVPIFNLPKLNIPEAIGLTLVVSSIFHFQTPDPAPKTEEEATKQNIAKFFTPVLRAFILIVIGYIVLGQL